MICLLSKSLSQYLKYSFDYHRLAETLAATREHGDLDFVYLGRKGLANASEPFLTGTDHLVHVDYSYWTLSYYITRKGAQKLIDGDAFSKLVPVDEYIPIMFDRYIIDNNNNNNTNNNNDNNNNKSMLQTSAL